MSGSTHDADGPDPAGIDSAKIREGILIGLRRHSPAVQLIAFSKTQEADLAPALLGASVILENAGEFDNAVIRRAGQMLEAHELSTVPGAPLPLWIYQAVLDRLEAENAKLPDPDESSSESYVKAMAVQLSNPEVRRSLLALLKHNNEAMLHYALTERSYRYPVIAVCSASVILEHANKFGPQLMADSISLLSHFGQSIEPGARLVATPTLIKAAEEANAMNDDPADDPLIAVFVTVADDLPSRANPLMN